MLSTAACGRRETYVTCFDAAHGVSFRYPAGWRVRPRKDPPAPWMRGADADDPESFYLLLSPRRGPDGAAAGLVAGLDAGRIPSGLGFDHHVRALLSAGPHEPSAVARGGARGLVLVEADGPEPRAVVALDPGGERLRALWVSGDAEAFRKHRRAIDEMLSSFTVERPQDYPEHADSRFGWALRIPPSWREVRELTRGGTHVVVFVSPVVGVDDNGAVQQASLTLTAEPLGSAGFAAYYKRKVDGLGDAFPIVKHETWHDGYADTIVTETAIATSRIKRFYRGGGGRGYCLAFEAHEDVFRKAAGWFDVIAETLAIDR